MVRISDFVGRGHTSLVAFAGATCSIFKFLTDACEILLKAAPCGLGNDASVGIIHLEGRLAQFETMIVGCAICLTEANVGTRSGVRSLHSREENPECNEV